MERHAAPGSLLEYRHGPNPTLPNPRTWPTSKIPGCSTPKDSCSCSAETLATGIILVEHPSFKIVILLAIAIWCFARAYYFAFYVVEHYVDPTYKFAGLWSFARYVFRSDKH